MKEMNEKWLYTDLTQEIIGAAIEVHRELGSGFLEYVYDEALCYELNLREILNFGKKSWEVKKESCENLCNLVVTKGGIKWNCCRN